MKWSSIEGNINHPIPKLFEVVRFLLDTHVCQQEKSTEPPNLVADYDAVYINYMPVKMHFCTYGYAIV